MGVPPNGWFIVEHPIKNGWFRGTPISGNFHIYIKYKIDVIICYPLNLGTGKQPNHAYSLVIKHGLLKRTI